MDDVTAIHTLATELAEARSTKKEYEEKIKDLNEHIKNIEEGALSTLMDNLGVSKISMEDMDIAKSLAYRPAYTKHTDKEAFRFLYDSNNDGALKKHLIVDLEAYPHAPMELDGDGIEYKIEYSIHYATLSSILKELVETGKLTTEDIEKYSIYIQPQIKVKNR